MNRTYRALAVVAMALSSAIALPVGPVVAQSSAEASVGVSDEQIDALASACASGSSSSGCVAAVQALADALTLANPGIALDTIISSIAAKAGSRSNAAISGGITINAAALGAATAALSNLASANGFTALANTVRAVAQNVANGVTVNVEKIAGNTSPPPSPPGTGSGGGENSLPDTSASPT